MKSEFSEFTYGYALIEEISRELSFDCAPIFPSLIQEGKFGGYDANIEVRGKPYFLQFKRSDYLSRSNSKHYGLFNGPYFRFDIRALKKSQQHVLLTALENSGEEVYYVAPKFYKESSLNHNYRNSQVSIESYWIEPTTVGPMPDDGPHSICFNYREDKLYLCSEPVPLDHLSRSRYETLEEFLDSRDRPVRDTNWEELYNKMVEVLKTHDPLKWSSLSAQETTERNMFQSVVRLAIMGFDSFILVRRS